MKLSFLKNSKKQTIKKISILLLAQLMWVTPSFAVTIKVGDAKITERQIRERANFNLIISNKPTSSANRSKIRKKTIEQLINETIQIAEAKKNGIKASDREINKRVGNIAASTRMSVSQLSQYLSSRGSSLNAMKGQHRAAMAWSGLIGRKFASLARVSDKEIDDKSKKLGSKYGKTSVYDLRHILLQMPSNASKSKRTSRFSDANKIRSNFTKCSRIRSLTAGVSRVKVTNKPDTSLSSLSSGRRNLIKNAKVGSVTKARSVKGGVELYAVCKKTRALSDKTRKKLQSIIVNEKMKSHAGSYLKTLRKSYNVKYL